MIRVVCICGRAFKTEDQHAGKHTMCPECGAALTIGPAPTSSTSGGDAKQVPAWWYPSDPQADYARATAPTQSGSNPGPDAVNTMILPPGHESKPQATLAAASANVQSSPPKAPSGPSFPVKKVRAIASGAIALLVLAGGALLWLRSAIPGADAVTPAPRGAQVDKPDNLGPINLSPSSVPGRNPTSSESGSVSMSAGGALTNASLSVPKVDVATPPTTSPAGASRCLRLLVPAYIYPAGEGRQEWQRLFDAASKVEIVAIANPNSGPGDALNLDYAAIFNEASNHGVTLVGYVSTNYCSRPQPEIKKDVDTWVRLYPQIHGFFFDQQPRDSGDAVRFTELRDYARRRIRDPLVITNPGVPCDESFLAQAVSNVTCVFVNYQGFDRFELPATLKAYEPFRFAAMPYNISDIETMRTIVKDAIIKRIGYLYISDGKLPNPWGKLPIYWEAEVEAVSRVR